MKSIRPLNWTWITDPHTNLLVLAGYEFWVQNAGQRWCINAPSDQTLRFELRGGDRWSFDPGTRQRSEISNSSVIRDGTPAAISYAFQVEPGSANTAAWLVLGQLHETVGSGSPPFAVAMIGERMVIYLNSLDASGKPVYAPIYQDRAAIQRGRYYSMDIKIKLAPSGDGYLYVTRDGVKIVNYIGKTGYAGEISTYWKEGIYRAAAKETLAVDFKDLSIKTGAAAAVTAGTGSGATTYTHDAAGNVQTARTTNRDGTVTATTYGIIGRSYATQVVTLSAEGAVTAVDGYTANGMRVYAKAVGATATTTDVFSAAGALLTHDILHGDGSRDRWSYPANGAVVHNTYDTAGKALIVDVARPDGSHATQALRGGLTLTSHAGVTDAFMSAGGDTFVFAAGSGADTIANFHGGNAAGHDVIDLHTSGIASFAAVKALCASVNGSTVIRLDATDRIVLSHVPPSALTASDFKFA